MFETDDMYRPIYGKVEEYFNQPVVYNGRNFILTLVKEGKKGEPIVIINNGWTIKDPFSKPVRPSYKNAWILGLYYKLSDPKLLEPKRGRIKKLWKENPEYFGCKGLMDSGKELEKLVVKQMSWDKVIIVGFTKSATMILNNVSWSKNVTINAICPIFKGTYSTIPKTMKKHMHIFWKLVEWILSEHIVDEDISVGSDYLEYADYSKLESTKVYIKMSSLDNNVSSTLKEKIQPVNVLFKIFSPIMEKVLKCEDGEQQYRSNGFLSFNTQWPPDSMEANLECIYASMPMALNHPKVKSMIQKQIYANIS